MVLRGPIRDFAVGIYDGPHATPADADDGPIFLGIKNVTADGRLDFSEIKHVSENDFPKWTRRVVPQADDVVFTYEATLHRYALIPEGFRGCLGRRMALVRPDRSKVDPRYLHYYFLSPRWRALVESNVISGATVDRIPIARFPEFEVVFPNLGVQKKIAATISSYDDLIENNRRRIQLLKQSARLLYKEWFVHLRFPGHEHVKVVDGVPRGWRKERLIDVAEINAVTLGNSSRGEIEYVDIASVTPGRINETTRYSFQDAPGRARRVVRHGDIIWSCVRPNRESRAVIWNPPENLVASTGFAVISPTALPTSYLYEALTTREFVGYLSNNAKGVAYPAVTARDFEGYRVLVPPTQVLKSYDEQIRPTLDLISVLDAQARRLISARDLLLPRLMSGEIEV